MHLLLLFCMLFFSYISGALLAFPLYELLNDPAEFPFHKLFRHCTLLCGFIYSFVLIRLLDLHKTNLFGFSQGWFIFMKQILTGLLIGSFILLTIETVLLSFSVHVFDNTIQLSFSFMLSLIIKGLITGIIVGFIEEILFRGTIYKTIENCVPLLCVICISATIYAAVHFVKFPVLDINNHITWLTGLSLLPEAFTPLISFEIWDIFLTLFLLGVLFALFRARYNSIAYSIGIHAGIVMMVKVSRKLTNYDKGSDWSILVNTTDHQLGLMASIVLAVVCLYCYQKFFAKRIL